MSTMQDAVELLTALSYGLDPEVEQVISLSFKGDPNNKEDAKWIPKPFSGWYVGSEDANNFSCVMASKRRPDGGFGRTAGDFSAGLCLMVDDLGTGPGAKFPLSLIDALPPSALIETSPDNYQALYFFDEPVRNEGAFYGLIQSFIYKYYTSRGEADPGQRDITRVFRLPFGVNGKAKYAGQARCRLALFEPTRRYHPKEIIQAFDLPNPADFIRDFTCDGEASDDKQARFEDILAEMQGQGRVFGLAGNGEAYEVLCPWVHEHSNGATSGSKLILPSDKNHWNGSYYCHHGHCQGRGLPHLMSWFKGFTQHARIDYENLIVDAQERLEYKNRIAELEAKLTAATMFPPAYAMPQNSPVNDNTAYESAPPFPEIPEPLQLFIDMFDGVAKTNKTIGFAAVLAFISMACGRNYYCNKADPEGMDDRYRQLQLDWLVIGDSNIGKSTSVERMFALYHAIKKNPNLVPYELSSWYCANGGNLEDIVERPRIAQLLAKSSNAQHLHETIAESETGVLIHCDEVGNAYQSTNGFGGYDAYRKSINNARILHGAPLTAPKSSNTPNAKPSVNEPAVAMFDTGTFESVAMGLKQEDRVESGFLSRSILIAIYDGERRYDPQKRVDFNVSTRVGTSMYIDPRAANLLAKIVMTKAAPVIVQWQFDLLNTNAELSQQLFKLSDDHVAFNRYHEYACKLAALYAVLHNPMQPVIDKDALTWAIDVLNYCKYGALMYIKEYVQNGIGDYRNRDYLTDDDAWKSTVANKIKHLLNGFKNGQLKIDRQSYTKALENGRVPISLLRNKLPKGVKLAEEEEFIEQLGRLFKGDIDTQGGSVKLHV